MDAWAPTPHSEKQNLDIWMHKYVATLLFWHVFYYL